MNARDELAALIDSQPTPEYAADAILAAGWVPGSRLALVRDSVRDVSQSLRAERDRLAATVARVQALHTQDDSLLAPGKWCPADGEETPCATIRALTDQGGPA